jgi:endonuclease/exonuclease/phosphatase family metal-dependent hydrolase
MGLERPQWLRRKTSAPTPVSGAETGNSSNGIEVVVQGPLGFVYLGPETEPSFLDSFAAVLVREGNVPAVVLPTGVDEATVHLRDRILRLPRDAAELLGDFHPHLDAVTQDLVRQAHHPGAGQLMLLGWGGPEPLTFQREMGSHGGPGPDETSAFVILSPEARTPTSAPHFLRPASLRAMALCAIDPILCGKRSPRSRAADFAPAGGIPLRIMTYNVHGCRGMDGKFAPQRIARVIAAEEPDVVCLQELDQERARSGGVNQAQVIADRLQADYHFHAAAELDDGRFGNAVISRHPLRFLAAQPLPSAPRAKSVLNLEDRGALSVALSVDEVEIRIVNTHLSILAAERRLQIEGLLGSGLLGEEEGDGPLLLAGDFNASPRSWTVRRLESRLRSVVPEDTNERALRTWSGRTPLRRIDHILVSDHFDARNVYVPRTRLSRVASDHLPLVVDLVCYPSPLPERERAEVHTTVS